MADDYSKIYPGTISKTVSSTSTPGQLTSDTSIRFSSAIFLGMKASRTNNTDTVWIQVAAADSSIGIPVAPGGAVCWTAPSGKDIKASDFYIDVNIANDGVMVIYQ